jgi:hypothetical protein
MRELEVGRHALPPVQHHRLCCGVCVWGVSRSVVCQWWWVGVVGGCGGVVGCESAGPLCPPSSTIACVVCAHARRQWWCVCVCVCCVWCGGEIKWSVVCQWWWVLWGVSLSVVRSYSTIACVPRGWWWWGWGVCNVCCISCCSCPIPHTPVTHTYIYYITCI